MRGVKNFGGCVASNCDFKKLEATSKVFWTA
jgi:hypothetical protein